MTEAYYWPRFSNSRRWRLTSASTSSGRLPCRARRSLPAITSPRAPLGAGDEGLAHLLPHGRVSARAGRGGGLLGERPVQFCVDVERCLAARLLAVGRGREHLAQLILASTGGLAAAAAADPGVG